MRSPSQSDGYAHEHFHLCFLSSVLIGQRSISSMDWESSKIILQGCWRKLEALVSYHEKLKIGLPLVITSGNYSQHTHNSYTIRRCWCLAKASGASPTTLRTFLIQQSKQPHVEQ